MGKLEGIIAMELDNIADEAAEGFTKLGPAQKE